MNQLFLREAVVADGSLLEQYVLEDTQFTSLPMDAMTNSLYEIEKHPILILEKESLVGFFILQVGIGVNVYTEDQNAVLLRAYSIDDRFQGKGYGKRSLEILPAYIQEQFPMSKKVILAVNHGNISAQMLYLKADFYDTKRRIHGEKGTQFIFERFIE
ncbi:GNAT family N-acetyltransferase [Carnobacterium gallinarum]|uniref:GNAT family N-acetyltransferase n=1 Tax=Carnobacterium gallinarum TaxID=2749 RepID=UPI00068C5140|nr:GNAT family N-acetyltransferase [Carnobacterium gallinarum]